MSRLSISSLPPSIAVRFSSGIRGSFGFVRFDAARKPNVGYLNAGLTEIEPDLEEEKRDQFSINSIAPEDFVYGEYDGHHTYKEGNEGPFWETAVEEYKSADPPTGFQGLISWLFLPAVAAGIIYDVPGEYLYIGAAVFVVIFCAIEMGKPDKPHNFEPQIYNMESKARDKLIADYNSMDIWEFNDKYGELWDFTVKNEEIISNLQK